MKWNTRTKVHLKNKQMTPRRKKTHGGRPVWNSLAVFFSAEVYRIAKTFSKEWTCRGCPSKREGEKRNDFWVALGKDVLTSFLFVFFSNCFNRGVIKWDPIFLGVWNLMALIGGGRSCNWPPCANYVGFLYNLFGALNSWSSKHANHEKNAWDV